MIHWMVYASFAIVLWGVNGLFMKLGTNRVSARSMVIWVTAGFIVLLPFIWISTTLSGLSARVIFVGLIAGPSMAWETGRSLRVSRKERRPALRFHLRPCIPCARSPWLQPS